ncbi:MAG: RusA family crossover junction endodeoxyribonuclease [Selenomonadaceae bacterium]|nr:RusA family crossover junction endodeoxyribonuclease [Selenomonadaceae bacterium]
MAMQGIKFEILTDPIPLARPRVTKGHAYLPKRSRDYRAVVQQAAKAAMGACEPLTGSLSCRLTFYRKFNPTVRNFGDLDNHVKAVLDALTDGICYGDDAQIVDIHASKRQDKAKPRVEVFIGIALEERID